MSVNVSKCRMFHLAANVDLFSLFVGPLAVVGDKTVNK